LTDTANASGTGGPFSDTLGALTREYRAFGGAGTPSDLEEYYKAAFAQENAALCLSGGGIRSTAFALGVVQALARMGLLTRFQYLSTVSGGGYLGAWLSR
jgi:predicted acylesterase/phospholipase RssA